MKFEALREKRNTRETPKFVMIRANNEIIFFYLPKSRSSFKFLTLKTKSWELL